MTTDKLNLHEIDQALQAMLEAAVDTETGEIDEDLVAQLAELEMEREDKILNCVRYMNQQIEIAAAYKKNADRLAKRAKRCANQALFLKTWVESVCNKKEKFEAPDIGVISFKPSERIAAHDIDAVPLELLNIPETPASTLDKAKAKAYANLHDGEAPAGCTITYHKSMQIR